MNNSNLLLKQKVNVRFTIYENASLKMCAFKCFPLSILYSERRQQDFIMIPITQHHLYIYTTTYL